MMAEGEEGNEFVQRNLLKMAIQLSKELPRKRISRRRVQYLKKACRGKMDHVCGEQDFNHQLHARSMQTICLRLQNAKVSRRAWTGRQDLLCDVCNGART